MKTHGNPPQRESVLLLGPPGAGAVAWAREFAERQRLWMGAIGQVEVWRAAGLEEQAQRRAEMREQPEPNDFYRGVLRAPHHSVSAQAMTGKIVHGWFPRPGELSLAHGGTLALFEVTEFSHDVVRVVRDAWQTERVTLHHWSSHRDRSVSLELPATFSLVASSTRCPCGFRGSQRTECKCTPDMLERWEARLAPWRELCGRVVELPEVAAG